jgi:hypothetical protein
MMNPDGLHMSPTGNRWIFDEVMKVINKDYPSVTPGQLPLHFPAYDHINVQQPGSTFKDLYGPDGTVQWGAAPELQRARAGRRLFAARR